MSALINSRCKAADVRRHDTGRKKTSDQAVSDPTAVCLPNMTIGETLSRPQQSHSLFTMSDIFAISSAIRDHRILEPLSSGKLFDHPEYGLEGSTPQASSRQPSTGAPTSSKEMVEPDGIEPTTSCLQSTRSPS